MPHIQSWKALRTTLCILQLLVVLAGLAISIVFLYENQSSFTRPPGTERVWFATVDTGVVIYSLATLWSLATALRICFWSNRCTTVTLICLAGLALCFLGYTILLCLQTQYLPTCVGGRDWLGFSNVTGCTLWKAWLGISACLVLLSCLTIVLEKVIKRGLLKLEEDKFWGSEADINTSDAVKEPSHRGVQQTEPWSPNQSAGTLLGNLSHTDETVKGSSTTAVHEEDPPVRHVIAQPDTKDPMHNRGNKSPDFHRGHSKRWSRIGFLPSRSPTPEVEKPGSRLSIISQEAPSITKSTLDFGETFGSSTGFEPVKDTDDTVAMRATGPAKQAPSPTREDSMAKLEVQQQRPRASSELYDASRNAFFKSIPTPIGHRRTRSSFETPRPSTSSSGVIARPSFSSKRSASKQAHLEVPDNFLTEIGPQPALPIHRPSTGVSAVSAVSALEPIPSSEELATATTRRAPSASKQPLTKAEKPPMALFSSPQSKTAGNTKPTTPTTPDWSPTIQHIKNASQQIGSPPTSPTLNAFPKSWPRGGTPSPNAVDSSRTESRSSSNGTASALSMRRGANGESRPQSPSHRALSPVSSSGSLRSTQPTCSTHRNPTWRAVSPENNTWVGNCVFRTIAYMLGLEPHVVFACRDKGYSLPPQGLTLDEIKLLLRRLADFALPATTRPIIYFPPPTQKHRPQAAGEECLEAICAREWDANRLGVLLKRSDGSCHCDLYVRNYLSTRVTGYKRYSDFKHLEDTDAHFNVKEPGTVVVGVFAFTQGDRADAMVATGKALDWDEQRPTTAVKDQATEEEAIYYVGKPHTISSDASRLSPALNRF